jgi:hypothetical protein
MCFCATANFAGSAVLGVIGVATLLEVKHRRELLFAAVPTLFAVHQFTEGIVWLGLDHILPWRVGYNAGVAFALYAQGLLPFLLPLSVLLIEPTRKRRQRMLGFVILGGALSLYILWGLIAAPLHVFVRGHTIVYDNEFTSSIPVGVAYFIATCGALLFSGYRYLVVFGVLNIIGLIAVLFIYAYAFTSLWCAYAAAMSIIIYFFFRQSRSKRPARFA